MGGASTILSFLLISVLFAPTDAIEKIALTIFVILMFLALFFTEQEYISDMKKYAIEEEEWRKLLQEMHSEVNERKDSGVE